MSRTAADLTSNYRALRGEDHEQRLAVFPVSRIELDSALEKAPSLSSLRERRGANAGEVMASSTGLLTREHALCETERLAPLTVRRVGYALYVGFDALTE
jgi:hypothetical protein